MKIALKFGIIIFTLLFELLLGNILNFEMAKPDFMLIVIICLSFLSDYQEGILAGFTGGFIKDIFSVGFLGTHALIKTAIGYISSIIKERVFYQHLLWLIAGCYFLVTFLNNILIFYLLRSLYNDYVFINIFNKYTFLQAVINSILSPLIFLGIKKLLATVHRWK